MKEYVSVIVPIYNCDKYLERCINSIVNQDYDKLDIILVNDGSTDNSIEICNRFAKKYKNIRVINKKNSGVSNSRNIGIKKIKGEFVVFIDADDYVKDDYISFLVKSIKENNTDCVITNGIDFNDNGIIDRNNEISKNYIYSNKKCLQALFEAAKFNSVCWGKIFKAAKLKNILFDESMKIAEDFKFVYEYLKKCNNIYVSNYRGYYYYLREGSAIRSGFDKKWNSEFDFCEELIKKYERDLLQPYIIKRYMNSVFNCIVKFKLKKEEKKNIIERIKKYKITIVFSSKITLKEKIKFIYYCYYK